MIRRCVLVCVFALAVGALLAAPAAIAEEPQGDKYDPKLTVCRIDYKLKGWSFVVKNTKGEGRIECENGQTADVSIQSWGGGFTAGKSEVIGGKGRFSAVRNIADLYGSYAQAEAHAGATKGGDAQVLSKGEVSLALSGSSQGIDLGVSVGRFDIKPK